jgi:hypothetical protein
MAKRRDEIWAKWRALVRQQTIGGQSAAAFCRERGINVTHYFEWGRKLRQVEATEARVVEVQMVPEMSRALEVRLADGRSVMVERASMRRTCGRCWPCWRIVLDRTAEFARARP